MGSSIFVRADGEGGYRRAGKRPSAHVLLGYAGLRMGEHEGSSAAASPATAAATPGSNGVD